MAQMSGIILFCSQAHLLRVIFSLFATIDQTKIKQLSQKLIESFYRGISNIENVRYQFWLIF